MLIRLRSVQMDILQAIILGIVQGITEWLPISSKSHLILVQHLFGLAPPVIFDLILHIGSLMVVFIVFWKDIKELITGMLHGKKQAWNYALWLIIATIPIALIGYVFQDFVESTLKDLRVLGFGFLFTALILFLSKYPKSKDKSLNWMNSLMIGIAQILALFPGVSRSGTTISTGMIFGVKKQDVARFSFLMFIPAILGATLLEFKNIGQIDNIAALCIGTIAAIVSGYLALKLLLNIIKKDRFYWFSIYCLVLGIIVLMLSYRML
jgi:undecaprenyl-diphosphatase